MFKVGQKVKIKGHGGYHGFTGELSGVVTSVSGNVYHVSNYQWDAPYLENDPAENLFHLAFLSHELEPA